MMPSTRLELKIRPTPDEKSAIEAAAREVGLSVSAFVLQCCLRKSARMTERNDLLVLNLIERAVLAVEGITSAQDDTASPTVVASNLAKADRLITEIGKLRSMLGRAGR